MSRFFPAAAGAPPLILGLLNQFLWLLCWDTEEINKNKRQRQTTSLSSSVFVHFVTLGKNFIRIHAKGVWHLVQQFKIR
jgi:hypothetical protein